MQFRKILSVLFAFALVTAMALPFSASAANDASITINYPEGYLINGQMFKAYKIFDVTTGGGSFAYALDPRFAGFTDYPDSSSQSLLEYLASGAGSIDDAAIARLAAALWRYIGAMEPDATAAGTAAQSVTLDSLAYGYYLVYSAGKVAGKDGPVTVVAANGLVTAAAGNIVINAKVDSPSLDKNVHNSTTGTWADWEDTSIGSNVVFKLGSVVPHMQGYTSYKFIVHDSMSAGLSFNKDVAVKINGANYPHFTVVTAQEDPGIAPDTFRIVFDADEFVKLTPGHVIEIAYSALVNENAIVGSPGNPNTVNLEFSNNPYDSAETGETPDDTVKVYTFDIDIYKFTGNMELDEDSPLAGAEFELRIGDEDGAIVRVVARR